MHVSHTNIHKHCTLIHNTYTYHTCTHTIHTNTLHTCTRHTYAQHAYSHKHHVQYTQPLHTLTQHTPILFSAKGWAGSTAARRIKGSAAKKGWLSGNAMEPQPGMERSTAGERWQEAWGRAMNKQFQTLSVKKQGKANPKWNAAPLMAAKLEVPINLAST